MQEQRGRGRDPGEYVPDDQNAVDLPATGISRLDKDLRASAKLMSKKQARFVYDLYATIQGYRIRSQNQVRTAVDGAEPNESIRFFLEQETQMESDIRRALRSYAEAHVLGRWAMGICGIGPVLAAGLLANVSPERWVCSHRPFTKKNPPCTKEAPHGPECETQRQRTASSLWSFAGLEPSREWKEGQLRPWNARLKVICWKIGESFVKTKANEKDVYGRFYTQRKLREWERNLNGYYAEASRKKLEKFRIGKDTDTYKWHAGYVSDEEALRVCRRVQAGQPVGLVNYADKPVGQAMLPPGHIHSRAKRHAVKIFLSHYHTVQYESTYKEPAPAPYAMALQGHSDFIAIPNWDRERFELVDEMEAA